MLGRRSIVELVRENQRRDVAADELPIGGIGKSLQEMAAHLVIVDQRTKWVLQPVLDVFDGSTKWCFLVDRDTGANAPGRQADAWAAQPSGRSPGTPHP